MAGVGSRTSQRKRASGAGSRSRPAGRPRSQRRGSTTPRVYTPPLRTLWPRTPERERWTLGYDVIDFARDVMGLELYPWQEWFLVHALELIDDGVLRYRTVVLLVARQNGKSTISQVLALWFMVVWGWPLVLGTAQDLDVAEEIWQAVVDVVEDDPDLSALLRKVNKTNGKKALELAAHTGRTKYKVKAASRRAGRGLAGNLVLLDELREHQTWEAWGAITKTTMAQEEALILGLSNAGDAASVVLRHLRKIGHRLAGDPDGLIAADENDAALGGPTDFDLAGAIELLEGDDDDAAAALADLDPEDLEPDDDSFGLFEWSAPPGAARSDRDGWAAANPSMGYGGLTERNIAAALRTDPEWTFRVEVLCQWPDGLAEGPFPPGSWEATTNEPVLLGDGRLVVANGSNNDERRDDRLHGPVVAFIDQSLDRSHTYVAVAGHRADGLVQAEIRAARFGSAWVRQFLLDHASPKDGELTWITRVAGQGRSAPVSPLINDLEADPAFTLPVVPIVGQDLLAMFGIAFEAVRDELVRHHRQAVLDTAVVGAATKKLGDADVLDRRESTADVAPLFAWAGAIYLMSRPAPRPSTPAPPPISEAGLYSDDAGGPDLTDDLATMGF